MANSLRNGKTREQVAFELLKRLRTGPIFSAVPGHDDRMTPEEASAAFRRWSYSWIVDDLVALVPELRKNPEKVKATEGPEDGTA